MNIVDLLKRWSELQADFCQRKNDGYALLDFYRVLLPPFDDDLSKMRIQFAVQQAIVAREWRFDLVGYVSGYFAKVNWLESDICSTPE